MVHTCRAQDVDDRTYGAVYEHYVPGEQNYCLVCERTEEDAEQTIPDPQLGEGWWRCQHESYYDGHDPTTCNAVNSAHSDACCLCEEEQ